MKYTRIVLIGYKRMRLNGIEHFEMKLESPLQLILGTNGSGKSSLLWELSPLPANAGDFAPGGSKTIEIEHRGHTYVLSSSFGTKQEHSFVCDRQELNAGHTITVQKELVKEHFKITTDVHELLSGQETFDTMSTARRKDWFLRLCDVNYDYALSVFGKLKNAHRDRSGAIRLERRALVVESEKLLSEQEIVQIGEETQWLHECLNHLLEHRKPVETDLTTLELQGGQLDKQLVHLAENFTEITQRINDREHSDADLVELIEDSGAQMVAAQTKITLLAEQHGKLAQKIAVLQKAGANTISGLEAQLAAAQAELTQRDSRALIGQTPPQPERALSAFESIKPALVEIFTTIPVNADKRYSQATLLKAREDLTEELRRKTNIQERMAEHRASLSHMRDHMGKPDATCPKCNHAFSLVYSEERMAVLTANLREKEDYLATDVVPGIVELERFIEECSTYGRLFRQFHQLTQSTPALQPYWDWLHNKSILTDSPLQGPSDLERIELDLRQQLLIQAEQEKIQILTGTLEQLRSIGEADLNELQIQARQVEEHLSQVTHELQVVQAANQHYKAQFALRGQVATIRKNIRKAIYAHRKLLVDSIEHQRRSILNQLIRDLQSALATREHALFAARRQKDVVEGMSRKIEQLVQEEKALGLLVKELSPTEGLIAEGMLGFIKNFCAQMNDLISKVWSYPLEVQSCEVVEGEAIDLDYRFPLLQGEERRMVPDVIKGSTGMREIVNLAFRMTAMQYLGMEDTALYLDEVGASFDKDHRTAAGNMIRSLIEQSTFPQVFMISHYQGLYGALANAQICVLNETNILTPQSYNSHVVMR